MADNIITKWCNETVNGIGGFKNFEKYELALFPDRDVAIVEFTIRCLANPENKDSKEVIDAIKEHRNKINANKMNIMHKQLKTEQFNEPSNSLDGCSLQGLEPFNILSKSADRNVADAAQDEERGGLNTCPLYFLKTNL